jgi:hypothetical protein
VGADAERHGVTFLEAGPVGSRPPLVIPIIVEPLPISATPARLRSDGE